MSKRMDLNGRKFGKLTVLKYSYVSHGNSFWECRCDCGNTVTVQGGHLLSGHTLSCGCYQKAATSAAKKTHGMTRTRIYRIYRHMLERCFSKSSAGYKDYGARGITVCKGWKENFENFRDWSLANGYSDNLSIDRIDNDKGYSPENCRWATNLIQCNNRRSNVFVEYNGKRMTLASWARNLNLKYQSLVGRWDKGIRPPELFDFAARRNDSCASV